MNYLATRLGGDLSAAVCFYGSAPDTEFERALKAANVKYERFLYPGTQHGFNNDTTPRYDADAAKLAWGRTLAFFQKHLR